MSITGNVGQTFTFTATDLDAAGAPDPNATNEWLEVDGAVDANGLSTGVAAATGVISGLGATGASVTALAAAAGSTFVATKAVDPDGNAVFSAPEAVTVVEVVPNTDTTSVTIASTVA